MALAPTYLWLARQHQVDCLGDMHDSSHNTINEAHLLCPMWRHEVITVSLFLHCLNGEPGES